MDSGATTLQTDRFRATSPEHVHANRTGRLAHLRKLGDMMAAAWLSDPTGRHEMRYWDGQSWTDAVADGGDVGEDPPTWPPAPEAAGSGLRSGVLQYVVGAGNQWPVLDGADTQVGWVVRGPFSLGGRSAQVWDTRSMWLTVKQSLQGTMVLHENQQVGRIGWHGIGAMSTVNISLELAGRVRARMLAKRRDLGSGTARVQDPAGTDLLGLQVERRGDSRVLTLQRLFGTPDEYEYVIQAMVPAIIIELNSRAGFDATFRDSDFGVSGQGVWPD